MEDAPLYSQIAESPEGGIAQWAEASDGVRLRLAFWPEGAKGTVLVLPGRTEFIEKYGRTADAFKERGYAMACIDWRGQGLSDRLLPNRQVGHVGKFTDYQLDFEALIVAAKAQGMPEPYFQLAHSMGGTIALRALQNDALVVKSVFSAPMWGLLIDPLWRPLVQAFAGGTKSVGLGREFAPGTGPANYVSSHSFNENSLTSSLEGWTYMLRMMEIHPGLEIGGPSIHWLYEAMTETKELMAMAPPKHDLLVLVGSDERVVDKKDILDYMARWANGQTSIVTGARHEIMMETPEIRKRTHDIIDAFFMA